MSRNNGGKVGRGDGSGPMEKITFRIDSQTKAALAELVRDYGPEVRGSRSVLLRKLVLEAIKNRRGR
jgi:hypothetical protein